jgi:hypothetical protein
VELERKGEERVSEREWEEERGFLFGREREGGRLSILVLHKQALLS